MMLAYMEAQKSARGHLVLYRVGEFYEVLGRDALTVSRAIGLQLTRRRQKDAEDVPMCGIPAGTSERAIARLLAAGHKVAVSEQPGEDGGERPLHHLTPATSVDADVVPSDRTNNLTVAVTEGQVVAFAWVDLSTGEASATTASLEGCGPALARITPTEILVARWPEGSEALAVAIRSAGVSFSDLPEADRSLNEPVSCCRFRGHRD
jgi:DNA mismatch repair protein MutS